MTQPPDTLGPGDDRDATGVPGPSPSGIDLARAALAAARQQARQRHEANRQRRDARRIAATSRSGARPDDRDPQSLSAAIERLLADRGWERPAAVGGVMGRWSHIVGPEMASHCQPKEFTDGVLTVQADSTAWATQVRLLSHHVVQRLNEDLGRGTVQRLRVLGPSAPSWRKGRLRAPGSRGPGDTYG